jgi:endonuclease/exonuclease/phosphatase family metal-dependent hydrolase
MLSRWPFTWNFVPFQRKHKGALVAKFKDFYNEHLDLVVAGVHLTAGLTDSSVAAKKAQLQSLTDYLTQQHDTDCCILAGDFNLVTSSYTISTALKDNEISGETVEALSSIETALGDAGLVDTWTAARVEAADEIISNTYEELFEGEEGATFDPRNNLLAAASFGTSNGRPQRYDRIFVRSEDCLKISRCNTFGLPEDVDGAQVVASDHSGIRSTLEVMKIKISCEAELDTIRQHEVERKRASSTLSSHMDLTSSLTSGGMFPTDEEVQQRATALSLLKEVILGVPDDIISTTSEVPMIIVPVGSYALGVWTSESDIDCLCIGTISSKTFFKLARQRLNKAHDKGVRVLRKVEASTGTMLELSVNGIYMDLQYCPAASVIER